MNEDEFSEHIQIIHQQIEALHRYIMSKPTQQQLLTEAIEELAVSFENLQLLEEQRQANLELMQVIQEELLQQNERLAVERQDYYELFNFAPDAYLLTNAKGIILKANRAAATLFNVLQDFLIGKPLANFVPEAERSVFRTKLNQLLELDAVQEWEMPMCSRSTQLFDAMLMVAPMRDFSGTLVSLQISIRNITKYKQTNLQKLEYSTTQLLPEAAALETPRSLDGLRVLFVDDEADTREFITLVLEQHGISVIAVASVAEALSELERSRPDVIISDIRMPDEDGYALIRKVKALEAEKGWQIPTAALTAYLAEDRAKAIKAGFQSHLHKLAEPGELVAMVTQLAGLSKKRHDG
ncbi:MAG: response regulator [Fischerella sp. CENA71]|nr:response regulator [Fischerella sp. CENA71]